MSQTANTPSARYRPLQGLGRGGMGEVELAVRSEGRFRRLYAIKRLRASMRDDESARTMFIDEGRLAGLVRHPNVVSVLDVGEDESGPYLVMDFVDGISASRLLKWASKSGYTLPVQLCLRLVREVAIGLHAAHELTDHEGNGLGLVHRDVSPQNILIGFDGISRIADFGIAKAGGRTTRTTTGLLKGKAGYMAPEQLRFEDPDRRTDIFSLGVVLYELLSSSRLYRAESDIITARRILKEPPPDIDDVREDVPPEVVDLLFRSLSKTPATRPSTAQEFARVLERCIATLVETEGAIYVGEYIGTHFAAEKIATRTLIEEQTQQVQAPAGKKSTVARFGVLGLILVLGVALVLGGLAFFRSGGETVSNDEPTDETPELTVVGSEPVRAEVREAESSGLDAPAVEAADDSEPPAAEPRATEQDQRARRRQRERRENMRAEVREEQLFQWMTGSPGTE